MGKSWIDSLLSFCGTCFADADTDVISVIAIGHDDDGVDVWWWWWYCCDFDVSFSWPALWSDDVDAIADWCALPMTGIGTLAAVTLAWDWMFRDFNNGGFLIDAENANPRRKIALYRNHTWDLKKKKEKNRSETGEPQIWDAFEMNLFVEDCS